MYDREILDVLGNDVAEAGAAREEEKRKTKDAKRNRPLARPLLSQCSATANKKKAVISVNMFNTV